MCIIAAFLREKRTNASQFPPRGVKALVAASRAPAEGSASLDRTTSSSIPFPKRRNFPFRFLRARWIIRSSRTPLALTAYAEQKDDPKGPEGRN